MASPLAIVLPVRFHEAIRTADRRHVELPSIYYGALQSSARSRAFTISGLAAIAQIREALDRMNAGLRDGMTFGEWKAEALARDWTLPDHRLELILRAHTQTAYNAGAWERFERTADVRGYLMYSAINDRRTRPAHRAMDGIIRPMGDSFWDDHSPPCGFNCRCGLISLTADQVRDRGGVSTQIPETARADPGWGSRPDRDPGKINEGVAREMLDLPEPLQEEVRAWHDTIKAERIEDQVRVAIGRYDEYLEELVDWQRENFGLLTDWEAVAIRAYTANHYTAWNNMLRGYSEVHVSTMGAVSSAVSGLAKLPAFEGTVYRGVSMSRFRDPALFIRAHATGEIVEYSSFTSASYGTPFHGDIRYTIHSRTGRVVEDIAVDQGEREVLFPPGTKFRVLHAETRGSALHLELEELEDQTVQVDPSHIFAMAADKKEDPPPTHSDALVERMSNETQGVDPEIWARFLREHDGMTPMQYALSQFPSARLEVEQAFPHLVKRP